MTAFDERIRLAAHARRRLSGALDAVLGDRLRAGPSTSKDDLVRVDGYALVERCARRVAQPADDYVDTAGNARRRLGLAALRRLHEAGAEPSVPAALTRCLDDVVAGVEDWSPGLGGWFEGLDAAGRAAVEAAAFTWAADVARLVGHPQLARERATAGDRLRFVDPFRPSAWNVPGRAVQLRGAVDAVLGTPRSAAGERLLVVSDALPGPADRLRAGHTGVVHALGSGCAPASVSIGSPAAGRKVRHEVDENLVDLVVDRIAEVVSHRADPSSAPPTPGRWCSHCHLLDVCAEGSAHLASPAAAAPA